MFTIDGTLFNRCRMPSASLEAVAGPAISAVPVDGGTAGDDPGAFIAFSTQANASHEKP